MPDVLNSIIKYFSNQKIRWVIHFLYYLIILLLLCFMYGFNDANAGTYIYNEF